MKTTLFFFICLAFPIFLFPQDIISPLIRNSFTKVTPYEEFLDLLIGDHYNIACFYKLF